MHKLLEKLSEREQDLLKKNTQAEWTDPMPATITEDYFSDPDWIYERKVDGERCLAYAENGKVRLGSRNRKDITNKYPEIAKALQGIDDCILDGELVAFDGNLTSFSKLQPRMQSDKPDEQTISDTPVYFYLFDIIHLSGYDLTQLPLRTRKQIFQKILNFEDPVRFMAHRNEDGIDYHKEACDKGWEGIIAKDARSKYVHSRSKSWLKFKCVKQQEFIIVGFTEPHGSRVGFGALHLGYYEDDRLLYAGKVGTGFNDELLKDLHDQMVEIKTSEPPVSTKVSVQETTWVDLEMVAEIGFTEWTNDGKLRHPRFLGLRDDKSADKVIREKPTEL